MFRTLVIEPKAKPRMTKQDKWMQRPIVVDYRAYANKLLSFGLKSAFNELTIDFYLSMPKSWSKKKKREMEGQPHQQTPDIDNLIKGFMDALLKQDCHVWSVNARKFWGYEGNIFLNVDG